MTDKGTDVEDIEIFRRAMSASLCIDHDMGFAEETYVVISDASGRPVVSMDVLPEDQRADVTINALRHALKRLEIIRATE